MDNYTCMANNCTVLFEVKEKPLKHYEQLEKDPLITSTSKENF